MNIFDDKVIQSIESSIIQNIIAEKYDQAIIGITACIDNLYANIPTRQRASYGIVHTVKSLSQYLFERLTELKNPIFPAGAVIFNNSNEFKAKMVALGLLSYYGLTNYKTVLPYFSLAAESEDWNVREISQMHFRKLIKKYPEEIKPYLIEMAQAKDAKLRRFVSETLRPVRENQWFYDKPDYSLSILKYMFKENASYPRTSVGNNLSDLARRLPEMVCSLVAELVASKNKDSYWIASRACRNLVKKNPLKVLNLLQIDQYKYKSRIYKRDDY